MSSSEGAQDLATRPRDGDIREQRPDAALDVLGAAGTSTGNNKNRLHQTCGPVNQHRHVCVEKCPLTMRHTAERSGDSCGKSQRPSFSGNLPRRQSLSENGQELDGDEEPEQPSSGNTDLHAQSRDGDQSGACQSSRPRTACEGA